MDSNIAKLLIETSHNVEVLTEQTDQGKQLYIEGIFAQAEVKNGNRRIYPKQIMEAAVDKFINQFVSKRRALGELNHPDRPFADPEHAAIIIEELRWEGNDVYGKAKVLNTPKGMIVRGLLEGGFNMGVSTRGLGSIKESNGTKFVQNDYVMTAVDCVDMPSGPDCYVNPIMESSWIKKNGIWMPTNEQTVEFDEQLFLERLEKFIKSK